MVGCSIWVGCWIVPRPPQSTWHSPPHIANHLSPKNRIVHPPPRPPHVPAPSLRRRLWNSAESLRARWQCVRAASASFQSSSRARPKALGGAALLHRKPRHRQHCGRHCSATTSLGARNAGSSSPCYKRKKCLGVALGLGEKAHPDHRCQAGGSPPCLLDPGRLSAGEMRVFAPSRMNLFPTSRRRHRYPRPACHGSVPTMERSRRELPRLA